MLRLLAIARLPPNGDACSTAALACLFATTAKIGETIVL
jgi:hypothetical protein